MAWLHNKERTHEWAAHATSELPPSLSNFHGLIGFHASLRHNFPRWIKLDANVHGGEVASGKNSE
jgi:hypothetical protein